MSIHTALLDLPAILKGLGLNVVVSDGWEDGQCDLISADSIDAALALGVFRSDGDEPFDRDLEVTDGVVWDHYRWTDPDTGIRSHSNPPSSYMVHHTAGASATIPSVNDSKANAWIGLERDGRLYQYGDGVPTIALVSGGPARISAGSGYEPAAWDYTFQNLRAPWKAEGPDTVDNNGNKVYLNRFAFSAETVCEGVSTTLDGGVWDHVVGLGVGLHQLFSEWNERTLGHASWTTRKTDPEWTVGKPNDGKKCIIDVQDQITEDLEQGDAMTMLPILEGVDDEDQTALADMLNETYGTDLDLIAGYDDAMVAAVKEHLGKYTGHPVWKLGKGVGGKQYSRLIQDYIKSLATPGPKGDDGDDGAKGDEGDAGVKGNTGPSGPQGIQGEPGSVTVGTRFTTSQEATVTEIIE